MKRRAAIVLLASPALAQMLPPLPGSRDDPHKRLPDGRLQNEAILKEDYERNLRDLTEMDAILQRLEKALGKPGAAAADRELQRSLQEVEKLSRRIQGRMRRF